MNHDVTSRRQMLTGKVAPVLWWFWAHKVTLLFAMVGVLVIYSLTIGRPEPTYYDPPLQLAP